MEIFGFNTSRVSSTFSWFANLGKPTAKNRAWGLLVIANFILLIAVSAFCIVVFTQVQAGNFVSEEDNNNSNETLTLDRQELNEAVGDLQKRRATFGLLRDRQPDIPNPSR